MTTWTTVDIKREYGDQGSSRHVTTRDNMTDAMYWAMENTWTFENWMIVMVYYALVNNNFKSDSRKLLREFILGENKRGCGDEEGKRLYEMAIEENEDELFPEETQ